jgi:type II secretory pathway pseudopilin PulG
MTNVKHNAGLSLVEILVVVGVIAVLAGLIVAITLRVENQSKERAVANVFALLRSALQEHYEDTGAFPLQPERDYSKAVAHIELLYRHLDSVPASRRILRQVNSAFVKVDTTPQAIPRVLDPWGTVLDYFYAPDNQFPELTSAGPDKKFGTSDDISSKRM